tara:strand:+ start:86 stop:628 length:543 start_codon:yes stop_codon:yes gene_type:complete
MNIFIKLPQYSCDSIIETNNQLRNAKKKLKKLEKKDDQSAEIKKLNVLINEYLNKNKYTKKKKVILVKEQIDDNQFLDKEVEKMKIVKSILLKENNKQSSICKGRDKKLLKWKYDHNMCYPISFRIIIVVLFCIHNRDGTLFNMLPKELMIYLLENNITWYSFPLIPNEQMILKKYPIEI